MTTPTLTPPVQPSYSAVRETMYRIKQSNFGDGYTQRAGDGINVVQRKFTMDFENMLPADYDTLQAFFDGLYGVLPFYYTLPLEVTQYAWITEGAPKKSYQGPNSISMNVTIQQVFDLL